MPIDLSNPDFIRFGPIGCRVRYDGSAEDMVADVVALLSEQAGSVVAEGNPRFQAIAEGLRRVLAELTPPPSPLS